MVMGKSSQDQRNWSYRGHVIKERESLLSIYKGRGGWSTENDAEEKMKISEETYTSTRFSSYNHTDYISNQVSFTPI